MRAMHNHLSGGAFVVASGDPGLSRDDLHETVEYYHERLTDQSDR